MLHFHAALYSENGVVHPTEVQHLSDESGSGLVFLHGRADAPLSAMDGAHICFDELDEPLGICSVQRVSEYWCQPLFGSDYSDVPDETQCLIARYDGGFLVILPVVSEVYRCVLSYDASEQALCARLLSQCDGLRDCDALAFAYTLTDDPFGALRELYKKVIETLGTSIKLREEREYPEMFEYLGWCSWDAFNIRVDRDGLLAKCREFKEKNIPVRWTIIDDMWADIPRFRSESYSSRAEMFKLMHSSPLASFEADPKRFPDGLAETIHDLKEYLTWVGIWHPTTGYWFGIDPESALFERFHEHLYKTSDGRFIPAPDRESFSFFFDAFHTFLEESGADFVKVDNQSIFRRFYQKTRPIGEASRDMHTALEASTQKHFGNRMINCMGCASENIWNRPSSAVSRCSDDFQPENAAWFTKHILQCAFMSLAQGALYVNDWDMWWTDDSQANKNSLLRAVSGGPVYVSDMLDRSKRDILMPLCYEDGKILRCDRPGIPTYDCLTEDPEKSGRPFKLQNRVKNSGVLAVFNLDAENGAVSGSISPSDVFDLPDSSETDYAVYEHINNTFFVMKKEERKSLTLSDRNDYRFYTFTPIHDDFAVIGRTDKLLSPCTVESEGPIRLYESGPWAYYKDGTFFTEER